MSNKISTAGQAENTPRIFFALTRENTSKITPKKFVLAPQSGQGELAWHPPGPWKTSSKQQASNSLGGMRGSAKELLPSSQNGWGGSGFALYCSVHPEFIIALQAGG